MDLSSPGREASRKSRSSSSIGSHNNNQITDSFSSLEPWQETADDYEVKRGAVLRGAASLPHIVKDRNSSGSSDYVLSKSESAVVNLCKSELVSGAGALADDTAEIEPDIDQVVLRRANDSLPRLSYDEMSPSLSSVVDSPLPALPHGAKSYDYLLKFLLVGDSDVGKQEILAGFEDGTTDSPFCSSSGAGKNNFKAEIRQALLSQFSLLANCWELIVTHAII